MRKDQSKPKRHPANAPGDFYVEDKMCITCMTPHYVAPELMGMHPENHCYFKKQPDTPQEIEHAIEAIRVACCQALRYAGNNVDILFRLKDKGCAEQCDALTFNDRS